MGQQDEASVLSLICIDAIRTGANDFLRISVEEYKKSRRDQEHRSVGESKKAKAKKKNFGESWSISSGVGKSFKKSPPNFFFKVLEPS